MISSRAANVTLSSATKAAVSAAAYTTFAVGEATGDGLSYIPPQILLDHLEAQFDTIAGGAAKVSAFMSYDAAGDVICQPVVEADIYTGKTTATKGAALWSIDSAVGKPAAYKGDTKLYVHFKLDAGTANLTPFLHWGV